MEKEDDKFVAFSYSLNEAMIKFVLVYNKLLLICWIVYERHTLVERIFDHRSPYE